MAHRLTTHSTGARVSLPFIVNLAVAQLNARPVNSSVSTDRKRRAVNERVSTRRFEVGLTTHSTRAESAWMSFARLDVSLNSSRRVNSGVRFLLNSQTQRIERAILNLRGPEFNVEG